MEGSLSSGTSGIGQTGVDVSAGLEENANDIGISHGGSADQRRGQSLSIPTVHVHAELD